MPDEIKPTPRNTLAGMLADALAKVDEKLPRMASEVIGVPAMARTMDRVSYGEPLTTGRGMTLKPREDTVNALVGAAPLAAGAKAAAPYIRKGAAQAVNNALAPSDMAMRGQRGALAPEAFGHWLAGTKVADEAGRPIVAYHGTNRDFNTFDASTQHSDAGFFFSNDPKYASRYASSRAMDQGSGANVRPVYLSIRNPMVTDDMGPWVIEKARADGHDGVMRRGGKEIVAFDPAQIKSAISGSSLADQLADKLK
jgi:hypothetical protein